jgi:hypothetical protein
MTDRHERGVAQQKSDALSVLGSARDAQTKSAVACTDKPRACHLRSPRATEELPLP